MKVGRRLVYTGRVKEGLAIRLESVGVTELKVAGVSQVTETTGYDLRLLPDFGEFVGPTAAELARLIYPTPDNPISAETNQRANCFASLLNRGSSLE
jgi:hypothetical protein